MGHLHNFGGKCLNVGSGEVVSMNHIRETINKYHKVEWTQAPERAGDIRHSLANIGEIKKLGWSPKTNIERGLDLCFKRNLRKFI
jgi:UDP-glucose 4-epimerase